MTLTQLFISNFQVFHFFRPSDIGRSDSKKTIDRELRSEDFIELFVLFLHFGVNKSIGLKADTTGTFLIRFMDFLSKGTGNWKCLTAVKVFWSFEKGRKLSKRKV